MFKNLRDISKLLMYGANMKISWHMLFSFHFFIIIIMTMTTTMMIMMMMKNTAFHIVRFVR